MTARPPLCTFRPFTPDRVSEVRAARELAWAVALHPPDKPKRKSTKPPSTPALLPNVPPEFQAMARAALKNLGL